MWYLNARVRAHEYTGIKWNDKRDIEKKKIMKKANVFPVANSTDARTWGKTNMTEKHTVHRTQCNCNLRRKCAL